MGKSERERERESERGIESERDAHTSSITVLHGLNEIHYYRSHSHSIHTLSHKVNTLITQKCCVRERRSDRKEAEEGERRKQRRGRA